MALLSRMGVAIGAVMPSVLHLGGIFRSWMPATSPTALCPTPQPVSFRRGLTLVRLEPN